MNRRTVLGLATVFALSACQKAPVEEKKAPKQTYKEKPLIPTDWDPHEMYTEYLANGTGVEFAGPDNRPMAFIAFDTQCSWCMRLMIQTRPLQQYINFVWLPVAVLNPHSEMQGAAILSSLDRALMLERHEAQFGNEGIRGLNTEAMVVPWAAREAVWTNTRIFRRSAARVVPFGVMKDANGEYQAIHSGMKTKELAALFGIKYE